MGGYWKTSMESKTKKNMIPEQLKESDFRFLLLKSKDKSPLAGVPDWQTKNNYIRSPRAQGNDS